MISSRVPGTMEAIVVLALCGPAGPAAAAVPQDTPGSTEISLEERLSRFERIRSCWSPSYSPDGSQIAFVSDLGGVPQVWTVKSGGGWPRLVTDDERSVSKVLWSPNSLWLAVQSVGALGQAEVRLVRPGGSGDVVGVASGAAVNGRLVSWTADGRFLLLESEAGAASSAVVLHDPWQGVSWPVAATGGAVRVVTTTPEGSRVLAIRRLSGETSVLVAIDYRRGLETEIVPSRGGLEPVDAVLLPDGTGLVAARPVADGASGVQRVPLDGSAALDASRLIASRDDALVEKVLVVRGGEQAVVLYNVSGRSEVVVFELADGSEGESVALPSEVVKGMVVAPDGGQVALVLAGAAAPSDIWNLDLDRLMLEQVTFSPHAGVALGELVRPRLVHWDGDDGLQLNGWLYSPPGKEGPAPTVVSLHGGPEAQERPRLDGVYQNLVANGIAVLAPNVRGSSGRSRAFAALDDREGRFGAIRDVGAAVDFLVTSGVADRRQVGVLGWSYGGYLALAALADQPQKYAAVGVVSGFADFEVFFGYTESWRAQRARGEYGDPERDGELLQKLSPIFHLAGARAPTLLIHGAGDRNVPASAAESVAETLRAQQGHAEVLLFPDEGHHFAKPENRVRASVALVRWFLEHLR